MDFVASLSTYYISSTSKEEMCLVVGTLDSNNGAQSSAFFAVGMLKIHLLLRGRLDELKINTYCLK